MRVHIAKINGILYSGEADSLTAPGVAGELTVLSHHMPLVTTLKPGRLTLRLGNEEVFVHNVEHGVLEVTPTTTTVLL